MHQPIDLNCARSMIIYGPKIAIELDISIFLGWAKDMATLHKKSDLLNDQDHSIINVIFGLFYMVSCIKMGPPMKSIRRKKKRYKSLIWQYVSAQFHLQLKCKTIGLGFLLGKGEELSPLLDTLFNLK
eukprot:TRINITY_DN21833_c0_g1_i1.p1 TRINITY_DN21833_c0_g1~~TRINITY_DN21833_c0_g1_i1.p1  ORF type:complete len:128 (+),score=11.39 TRINITY_DN21833_c0_g1_i1:180-563(+)